MGLLREIVNDGFYRLSIFLKENITEETIVIIPSGVFTYRLSLEGVDYSDVNRVIEAVSTNRIKRNGRIVLGGKEIKYQIIIRKALGRSFLVLRYNVSPERVNYSYLTLDRSGKPRQLKLTGVDSYLIEVVCDGLRGEAFFIFGFNMRTIPTVTSAGIGSNENLLVKLSASYKYYREQGFLKLIMDSPEILADAILKPLTISGVIE